jgi:hypothetical protein
MSKQSYDQFYSGMSPEGKLILTPAFAARLECSGRPAPACMLPPAGRGRAFDAAPADREEARHASERSQFKDRLTRYHERARARDGGCGGSVQAGCRELEAAYSRLNGQIAGRFASANDSSIEEIEEVAEQQERALRAYKIKYGLDAARTHGRTHVELEAAYAAKRGRP